jgi:DNA-binding CsgD family transcriptional regulator
VLYPVSAGYSTIATLTMIDRLYGPTKASGKPGRLSEPQLPRFQCRMATPGASALSAAELRLLPAHLTLTQVAAELFLSPHTVRTQAKSIYRKLGTPARSHAVARARQLGLLDGLRPGRFHEVWAMAWPVSAAAWDSYLTTTRPKLSLRPRRCHYRQQTRVLAGHDAVYA